MLGWLASFSICLSELPSAKGVVEITPNNIVEITPPWPAPKYHLACPTGTPSDQCQALSELGHARTGCFEPERETAEVITAMLLGKRSQLLYVDIGCNIGAFAAQAARLGAAVDCFEPSPRYVDGIRETRRLSSHGRLPSWNVTQAFVMADDHPQPATLTGKGGYTPCGVGSQYKDTSFVSHTIPMRPILLHRHIDLLKIDIDSIEGKLLSVATQMIKARLTSIRSILIEAGPHQGVFESCLACAENPTLPLCHESPFKTFLELGLALELGKGVDLHNAMHNCINGLQGPTNETGRAAMHARGAAGLKYMRTTPPFLDARDLIELQSLGYSVYRINIHTNREIYNSRGVNVNQRMSPMQPTYIPVYGARGIRKLEFLPPGTPLAELPPLIRKFQSFLITKEILHTHAVHHEIDLKSAAIPEAGLNDWNLDPSLTAKPGANHDPSLTSNHDRRRSPQSASWQLLGGWLG